MHEMPRGPETAEASPERVLLNPPRRNDLTMEEKDYEGVRRLLEKAKIPFSARQIAENIDPEGATRGAPAEFAIQILDSEGGRPASDEQVEAAWQMLKGQNLDVARVDSIEEESSGE